MNKVAKVTLNGLLIAVCGVAMPMFYDAVCSTAAAAPSTTGKPGRLEPGGRRAMQPQDFIQRDRI